MTRFRAILESRLFPPICLAAAFLVRVGWILLVHPKQVSDFQTYFTNGVAISLGHGYRSGGVPTAMWPVGYSAFLAALFAVFGRSLLIAKLANAVLYIGVIALSYRLAQRLFRSSLTPPLTMLALSLYPNHIAYSSLVASETLFVFLFLLGALLIVDARSRFSILVLSGIVLGLASLVRTQALLAPAIFVLLAPGSKLLGRQPGRRLVSLAVVYFGLVLAVFPWAYRNYKAFGRVVLVSTNGGGNLLLGNNPWANGAYTPRPEFASILTAKSETDREDQARNFAVAYMRGHPLETVMRWPGKLWYLYRGDIEGIRWNAEGLEAAGRPAARWIVIAGMAVAEGSYLLVGAVCLASLLLYGRRASRGAFPAMGLGVLVYFSFLGVLFYGDPRYHFPVIPWIAMYAAALPEVLRVRAGDEAAEAPSTPARRDAREPELVPALTGP